MSAWDLRKDKFWNQRVTFKNYSFLDAEGTKPAYLLTSIPAFLPTQEKFPFLPTYQSLWEKNKKRQKTKQTDYDAMSKFEIIFCCNFFRNGLSFMLKSKTTIFVRSSIFIWCTFLFLFLESKKKNHPTLRGQLVLCIEIPIVWWEFHSIWWRLSKNLFSSQLHRFVFIASTVVPMT